MFLDLDEDVKIARRTAAMWADGLLDEVRYLESLGLREAIAEAPANLRANAALANLAEGIQGLVTHMRSEQQLIRDWVEGQAADQKELRRLMENLLREKDGA